ncbi:uncharacterized protein METZ01_LOCUS298893, partial [marine metagenome]
SHGIFFIGPSEDGGVYIAATSPNEITVDGSAEGCSSTARSCVITIKLNGDGTVAWSASIKGPHPQNAGNIPQLSMISASSDTESGFSLLFSRAAYNADSGSDVNIIIQTSTGNGGGFVTGSNNYEGTSYYVVSISSAGTYQGYADQGCNSCEIVRLGDFSYVLYDTVTSNTQGQPLQNDTMVKVSQPNTAGGTVTNITQLSTYLEIDLGLVRFDGGVYVWYELTDTSSDVQVGSTTTTHLTLSQDHYLLNVTADGGYADGRDTLGYEILHYYQEDLLFIENSSRIHTLSDIGGFFTYRGSLDYATYPEFDRISTSRYLYNVGYDNGNWTTKTFLLEEDFDDDDDGLGDSIDDCPAGDLGWTPDSATDWDSDGCQDSGEDTDDDNDG